MATLAEVKEHGRKLFARGELPYALRLYDAIVAAAPLDWDARIKVGDCLAGLGDVPAAAAVWRAAGWYCLKAGHPLPAVVAGRLLEAHGQDAEDLYRAIVVMYGSGSDMLGKLAARIAPPAPETQVVPPDLRVAPPPTWRAEAAERAAKATETYEEFPEALHPIPLLSEMSDAAFRRVLGTLLVKRLPDATPVIREGEPGTSFFFVAGGEVRVYATDVSRRETELARLHEGSLFGEMALLGNMPRTASVTAVQEADLLEVSRDALAAIADELAPVAAALDKFTRERLLKNLMATSPLFRPFNRVQQLELLRRFTAHDVALGTPIIRQGEEGRGLFVVLTGEVDVTKTDDAGATTPLAHLRAGELFGEIALVRGGTTTATVTAARRTTVLFLAHEYFQRLVEAVPAIRTYFEEIAEERLISTARLVHGVEMIDEDEAVLV